MLRRIVRHVRTNVSEQYASSIFRTVFFHPEEVSSTLSDTQVIYRTTGYTTEAAAFIANSPHAPRTPHNYTQLTRTDIHNGRQTTWLDDPGFPIRQRQEISLFFKTSTASLGPIKPAIRWAKCFFPEGKAARARS